MTCKKLGGYFRDVSMVIIRGPRPEKRLYRGGGDKKRWSIMEAWWLGLRNCSPALISGTRASRIITKSCL